MDFQNYLSNLLSKVDLVVGSWNHPPRQVLDHSHFQQEFLPATMKTIYWPIVMLTCSHLIIFCWADYILDAVFDFCDGNGYKYVTFADFDVGNLQQGNSTKLAFNQGIRTRSLELVKDFHLMEDIDMLVS